ncbi:MAG: hypothetical protein CSA75_04485 [Sorangium cellulosum]|nr:MAG: hypothetical protein CSA75_04485 [Sorangium cellulosum]
MVGGDAGFSDVSADIGSDVPKGSSALVNPLCGVGCDPDDFEATKCNSPSPLEDGGKIEAGLDATIDADLDKPDEGEDGNMGGSMGGKSPYDQVPNDDDEDPGDEINSPPAMGCQVTADSSGHRHSACVPAGTGTDSDPCVTSSDCAAGYACVGEVAGVCRSYCCLDAETCPNQRYCGVQPSHDQGSATSPFLLPVCIPAADCELLPTNRGNGCSDGLICTIVRANGTTACVQPGMAKAGEPCETSEPGKSACAEGFVCSKATNTCLALCSLNAPESCHGGACQGGTNGIPDGYGVCVGSRE